MPEDNPVTMTNGEMKVSVAPMFDGMDPARIRYVIVVIMTTDDRIGCHATRGTDSTPDLQAYRDIKMLGAGIDSITSEMLGYKMLEDLP
jgi:hypothetical protein